MVDKPGQILNAARSLFSAKGYAATSMRDIASAVDLQPGSLYAHMAAKEDLLSAILAQAGERFLNNVSPILTSPDTSAGERLREAVRAHIRVVAENIEEATVFFHEWRSLSGKQRTSALRTRRTYENHFRTLIEEGVENGEFRDVDPVLAGIMIFSLMNWTYTWFSPTGPLKPDEVADYFVDVLLHGLNTEHAE